MEFLEDLNIPHKTCPPAEAAPGRHVVYRLVDNIPLKIEDIRKLMMKLKMKDVYVYYDFPILFSAVNGEGDTFICLFAEETDSHLRYICVKVSPAILFELENNQKDVRTVFEHSERVLSILLNAQSEEPVEAAGELEDITPFLPDEGLFIGKSQEVEAVPTACISISPIMDNTDYISIK